MVNAIDNKKVGVKLYGYRVAMGWTVQELADELGVSLNCVYKWESGLMLPTPIHLVALANLYDITIDNIIRG